MAVFAVAYFSEHKTVNAAPTVNIYANGQPTFLLIDNPGNVTITWDSQGAASCLVNQGQWTGTTGSQSLYVSAKTVVDAYCQDALGGVTAAQVEISVSGVGTFDLCEPESQTASVGQTVTLTSPFAGSQTWSAPDGNPSSGTGSTFQTIYSTPGLKIVQGITGTPPKQGSDSCSVYVTQPSYSLTASPNPISPGQTTNVSWNISSIPAGSSCTIAGYMGGVERFLQSVSTTTGSFTTPALDYNHEVYLNCGYISASPSNYVATTTIKVTLTCGPSNPIVINVNELRVNGLQTLGGYVSPEGTTTSSAPGNIYASGGAWLDLQYATSGSKTITVSSSDGQTVYCGATVSTVPLTVNISLSTNPINNEAPNDITVTWDPVSGSGITCTASGAWSGSKSPSGGSEVVNAPVGGVKSFTLYCSNSTGDGQDSEQVTITNPLLLCAPNTQTVSAGSTANMSASGGLSPFTWSITSGVGGSLTSSSGSSTGLTGTAGQGYTVRVRDAASQTADCYVSFSASSGLTVSLSAALSPVNGSAPNNITLTWTITGATATACVASGDWSGNKSTASGSSQTLTSVPAGSYSYTIYCSNATSNDTDTENVTINVPGVAPTVSLSVSPNQITTSGSTTVGWTLGGSPTSCTYSSSPTVASWNDNTSTSSSSEVLSGFSENTFTFTLSCTNAYGTTQGQATLVVSNSSSSSGFSGSLSAASCNATYPATSCTGSVTWSTTGATYTMVRKSVDGAASTVFDCVSGSVTNRSLSDTLNINETVTYELYNSPNCSFVPSSGIEDGVVLMWTNPASIPSGWVCVSCSGQSLYNVFPRMSDTAGGAGGYSTHTHTMTFQNYTYSGSNPLVSTASGFYGQPSTHTHTWQNITSGTGSNVPSYQDLVFIQSSGATSIPAGAIAMFESSVPSGWSRYTALDNVYLRGAADTTPLASTTHAHTYSSTSGSSAGSAWTNVAGVVSVTSSGHTHSISGSLSTENIAPEYATIIFAQADSSTNLVPGNIAMFLTTSPANWVTISGSGSSYNGKFLKGSTIAGTTGGVDSHTHDSGSITVLSGSGSSSSTRPSSSTSAASNTHKHNVTYSINTISGDAGRPPYRDVLLGKYRFLDSDTAAAVEIGGGDQSNVIDSNKDIVQVRNEVLSFDYSQTAEANLVNIDPLVEGDLVKFAIHVRNSGLGTVVGDIVIEDTMVNIEPENGDFQAQIFCNDSDLSDPASCTGLYTLGTIDYDAATGVVSFTINSVGGELEPNDVLSLVYTVKTQGSINTNSTIFRLGNEARIDYTDSVAGDTFIECNPGDPCNLRTPSVLFFRDLSVPFFTETY